MSRHISAAALLIGALLALPPAASAQPHECASPVAPSAAAARASQPHPEHGFATGRGVKVAVIDTGVAAHPRLGPVVDGGDFLLEQEGGALTDCDGHGTIVAGVIAARPDPHDGVVGIAPAAEVISIRQSSGWLRRPAADDHGNLATLANAIDRAVELDADVINISVVACLPARQRVVTADLDAALDRAERAGAVVVAAAGNEGAACRAGDIAYPASSPTVLAVGAVGADYSLDSSKPALSARGHVDVGVSPSGEGLAAGLLLPRAAEPTAGFEGTSFAAPVVSGVAALLLEREPQLSPARVRARIIGSTDPASGRVNPVAALTYLADVPPPPQREVMVTPPAPTSRPAAGRAEFVFSSLVVLLALGLGAGIARVCQRRRSVRPRDSSCP